MPPLLERKRFNIEKVAGPILAKAVLFQFHEKLPVSDFIETDEFRTRIVLNGEQPFDPGFLQYAYGLVAAIDGQLNAKRDGIPLVSEKPQDGSKRAFARLYGEETVENKQREYLERVKRIQQSLSDHRKTVMALPMRGALPIQRAMEGNGILKNVLIPVHLSGSVGTTTGFARFQGRIPEEILDPENVVMICDDVFDTVVTTKELGLSRLLWQVENRAKRVNYRIYNNPDQFSQLMRQAKEGELPQEKADLVWKDLAEMLWDVDVIAAPFSIKNTDFANAVLRHAFDQYKRTNEIISRGDVKADQLEEVNWARAKAEAQIELMVNALPIDKKSWIIGGCWGGLPLLDSKVHGRLVLEEIEGYKRISGLRARDIRQLREWGLERTDFRLFAGLDGLWVYNPDGIAGDEALKLQVRYLARHIEEYARGRLVKGQI